ILQSLLSINCNTIRTKLRNLVDSREMKIGELCKTLGVSNKSYNTFMSQNGPDKGMSTAIYPAAAHFFYKREKAGISAAKKQKVVSSASSEPASAASNTASNTASIVLDGEMQDAVPIHDSCDEIRRKINAYMQQPNVTKASFARELQAQYHTSRAPTKIQGGQVDRFRSMKGADAGNTNCVFYAAYVLFEKQRLAAGKPKSKHRLQMEREWPGGFDVERGSYRKGVWAPSGASVKVDGYGKYSVRY
ncbi:hypothetical protein LTS18_005662, partial [Coniosporium uncinatum]